MKAKAFHLFWSIQCLHQGGVRFLSQVCNLSAPFLQPPQSMGSARYPSTSALTRFLADGSHAPKCTHTRLHSSLTPPRAERITFPWMVEAALLLFGERWPGRGDGCRRVHEGGGRAAPSTTSVHAHGAFLAGSAPEQGNPVGARSACSFFMRKPPHISTARQSFFSASTMARHLCPLMRIRSILEQTFIANAALDQNTDLQFETFRPFHVANVDGRLTFGRGASYFGWTQPPTTASLYLRRGAA